MIDTNRLKHMLGVARRCYDMATERGWDTDSCNRMYFLGLLHDIGYEFSHEGHNTNGAAMLRSIGFPLANEVARHGVAIPAEQMSEELKILNLADLRTLPDGDYCTAWERLEDTGKRYGKESTQYIEMQNLILSLAKGTN